MSRAVKYLKKLLGIRKTQETVRTVYEPNAAFNRQLLAGQTALVTGAARNIGRAIVKTLADQGASVAAVDIDPDGLNALEEELRTEGHTISTYQTDLGSEAAIVDLCHRLDADGRRINLLVNNVGIHADLNQVLAGDFGVWNETMNTNLVGSYRLTREVSNRLIEQGEPGSVVFLSSVHQYRIRHHPAYSASKAGVGMVVRELAVELGPSNIRVNAIAPGAVLDEKETNGMVLKHIPLHQIHIPPKYIARAVLFLSSEFFSRHTTGSVLVVDAGLTSKGFG